MKKFVIFTDSACDLSAEFLSELEIEFLSLTFRFSDDNLEYSNGDMSVASFYERMRGGGVAKTSAVNSQSFLEAFKKTFDDENDILYVGFSSGLSTTFNSARMAANELVNEYPDRKVRVVDSLCASAGLGLLLKMVADARDSGATLDEAADYAESIKMSVCHWFTVDDLVYLKRGGRVSPTVAFVGNVLGIKPVMHVDNDGHLVNCTKVRGRKTAINALADKYTELAKTPDRGYVYISHGDCKKDAELLAEIIKTRHGNEVELITDVGPVIGAHSGPGTLALFFIGKER